MSLLQNINIMIIDLLKNSARIENLNPYFKQAFDYLKSLDFTKLEAGKTELDGDSLFVMVNDTNLKTKDAAKLEVHNKYIDIQIPVSCAESFGWKERTKCKSVNAPFDEEKDFEFYDDVPTTYFTLQSGEFVIFFPEDGHAPCIGEGSIRKIIIKVKN